MTARPTPAVMIQGTGSDVGKSLLVAGLCRAAANRGLSVAPFKAQNMSNNAAVTADGGEIGRAQELQARAARRAPTVHMNPVLIKPDSDTGAQVVVHGAVAGRSEASRFGERRGELLPAVLESFGILERDADLVIVEGAGSAAETNLRAGDIANMGFAQAAGVPVVLAGDIDRGGVIAQLVGTHAVLDPADRALIQGFLVNRFRGDVRLFDDGYANIAARTGWQGLGVVPWFVRAALLPEEDAVRRGPAAAAGELRIVCPMLSRISNADDLDPLAATPGVHVEMVPPGRPLPQGADLIVLPGTKSTRGDLAFLRTQGWDVDLLAHVRQGGRVLGICGGFQMLGTAIHDPEGVDGAPGSSEGLGLLPVETQMLAAKRTTQVTGRHTATGAPMSGYEIHAGATIASHGPRSFAVVQEGSGERAEGAVSVDGRIAGTYLHGLFAAGAFRAAFLAELGVQGASSHPHEEIVDGVLDELAEHLEAHVDVDAILTIARRREPRGLRGV